ncbi:MAG: hypothetical protein OXE44_18780 [Nitrospinae bacterium]|nr:hypothetical protein [Nitrospinota bacterium]
MNENESTSSAATSYPATSVHTILEALATSLALFHEKTEDFPLHMAGVVFQESLGEARDRANLTQVEDEAFRQLRDHVYAVWNDYGKS